MLETVLFKVLFIVVAANLFALGVLVLFLINARINLKRNIKEQQFILNILKAVRYADSTAEATKKLGISVEKFEEFCALRMLETPDQRKERIKLQEEHKEAESKRIMAEEAKWRAEQDRAKEEHRKNQEEDSRARKDRLRKFGFH